MPLAPNATAVRFPRVLCVLLIGLLTTTVGAQQSLAPLDEAYFAAHDAEAPIRNFVYLVLRVAGVVWIVVEWIAAIYLIRGFNMLRLHIASRSRNP